MLSWGDIRRNPSQMGNDHYEAEFPAGEVQ